MTLRHGTIALCLLFLGSLTLAQEKPVELSAKVVPLKLEGKVLRKVNPDDAMLLGVIARGLLYQAQKDGKLPADQAFLSGITAKAFQDKDTDSAYRHATRFILIRKGLDINEGTELATSYDFRIDRRLATPGDTINIVLEPLFLLEPPPAKPYTARLTLRSPKGDILQKLPDLAIKEVADLKTTFSTKDLKPGKYVLHYELLGPDGKAIVECGRDFLVTTEVKERVSALHQQLDRINGAKLSEKSIQHQAAVETLAYIVELFERTMKEYVAPMPRDCRPMTTQLRGLDLTRYDSEPFDIDKDLGLAEVLAKELLDGKNPLATRTGDLRLAYRSVVDKSLQPFRVFLPKGYDPARQWPLIVALHGATGDESTYMDRYLDPKTGNNLFKKLGEERGYLLVTPNGRGAFGLYQGNSEKDVLEVLERVQKLYSVNAKEVFLTGHSMGALGTWQLGFKHPEKFAALAPVAGRPLDASTIALKNAPEKPVFFTAGLKDTLVSPESTRQLAEIAKKELKNFKYVEYPDDHFVIGVTTMPAVFDFFDAHRPSKKP